MRPCTHTIPSLASAPRPRSFPSWRAFTADLDADLSSSITATSTILTLGSCRHASRSPVRTPLRTLASTLVANSSFSLRSTWFPSFSVTRPRLESDPTSSSNNRTGFFWDRTCVWNVLPMPTLHSSLGTSMAATSLSSCRGHSS